MAQHSVRLLLGLLLALTLPRIARSSLETITFATRSFDRYDYLMRPSAAASTISCKSGIPADRVKLRIHANRFHTVEPSHGTFGIDGFVIAVWEDSRLAYNAAVGSDGTTGLCENWIISGYDYSQRADIDVSKQIWVPDIFIPDDNVVEWKGPQSTTVFPNGTVEWSRSFSTVVHCSFRLDAFPYDSHSCKLKLGLYSQVRSEVELAWTDVQDHFTSHSWSLGAFAIALGENSTETLRKHTADHHSALRQYITFTRSPTMAKVCASRCPRVWHTLHRLRTRTACARHRRTSPTLSRQSSSRTRASSSLPPRCQRAPP